MYFMRDEATSLTLHTGKMFACGIQYLRQLITMKTEIILVDENDNQIGVLEKLEAHKLGKLHRGFSVFIFNSKGQMLIQKRALSKYHSGGLWSNSCCSHPMPNEDTLVAAKRRLKEEMGISCNLKKIHQFIYKTKFSNGLTEYEYDYVFVGRSDDEPTINPEEADDWKWVDTEVLNSDVKNHPHMYTHWFKMCLDDVLQKAKLN